MSIEDTNNNKVMEAKNIAKSYGSVQALKGVDFPIYRGKVTTLFGENGAGKSTLMKVLSGIIKPSSGDIILDDQPVVLSSSTHAQYHGISIIHQELSLCANLSVRDNIFLGREIRGKFGIQYEEEARQVKLLMAELQETIDPLTKVASLRLGQQQLVEIARALSMNTRILIMDEPTSALSAAEVEVLFKVVRDLTNRGVSIVYISHHLEEALHITDHAVVLRDGLVTAYGTRNKINLDWIVKNMVGENFHLAATPVNCQADTIALAIKNLCINDPAGSVYRLVDNVSLELKQGEIIAVYGLMGSGRTELLECLAGRLASENGDIVLHNESISQLSIAERIQKGIVLIPEDRQRDGLVQTLSVGRNLSLASISTIAQGLFIKTFKEKQLIDKSIEEVMVKTSSHQAAIESLSGGNQQKVVIGKMLATHPSVILLDEPSRGIDVAAKAEIFKLLTERAQKGVSVLYTTSEINECLSTAHKVVVMRRGKVSAIFTSSISKEKIMSASGEAVAC